MTAFALFFSLLSFDLVGAEAVENSLYKFNALENRPALEEDRPEEDSLYRYSALENKVSFIELSDPENPDTESLHSDVTEEMADLARKAEFSVEQIENAIGNRNGVRTLILGPDLAVLKFQLVQVKEEVILLRALADKTEDGTIKSQINNQIAFLKKEQKKVENFILKQKNEFSLFGWFVSVL